MAKAPRKTGAQSTGKMAVIGDTLSNVIIGLGTDKEKLAGTRFSLNEMDQAQANMAYRGDWVARKIVDIPASDATREWRSWQAEGKDITAIEKVERSLGIQLKTRNALKRARLHGGSVMIIGVDDGNDPSKELNLNRVKKDSLKFVHTLSRWAITAGEIERDPLSPYYGEPKYYRTQSSVSGSLTNIHPSRVVRFQGLERPDAETSTGSDGAWGDSVLQIVSDAVRSTGLVTSSVAQLVSEAKIDVVKVPDLSENLTAQGYEQLLQQRFANVNILKSVFGFLVLDNEETYEQQATSFTGLPDIMRMFLMMVCGAADIPATRFMAQSPNGMSSTGDSDTRNYYDRLSSDQNMDMTPALSRLDEVLLRSALGTRPEDLFYNWNSLWQMDDAQAAEIAVKKANVFKIDSDAGLMDSVVLKKAREAQLIEDGTYPGLEAIIEEFDGQGEEQQQQEVTPPVDPETGAPIDQTGATARVRGVVAQGGKAAKAQAADPKAAKKAQQQSDAALKDESTPRSLYMRRDVLNAKDIRSWAKSQGFQTAMPANQMHVTIIYSKEPVDWLKIGSNDWGADKDGNITIAPGGPRVVEKFGNAIVLAFSNSDLAYRNMRAREEGATYDFPDYTPHITFTYNLPAHIDLASVEPYRGKIELGPEIFEEIKQSFDPKTMLVEDEKPPKERKL